MSRSLVDRLRELETDVHHLDFLPAAAVRARGRRRGRRRTAGVAVAAAVLATTAGVTAVAVTDRPSVPAAAPIQQCVVGLPSGPAAVRVRLLGGTATTADGLRARRFTVLTGPATSSPAGATRIQYGPATIGAAALLRAYLRGDVTMLFEPSRRDDTVDVTPGATFVRLATATEVNQSLVEAGPPTAPPQCTASR